MMRVRSTSRPTWRALLCSLSLVVAFLALSPLSSHAIPVAGDYVWDANQDIVGMFTSNGSQLTSWVFQVGPYTFNTLQDPTPTQSESEFGQFDFDSSASLNILWSNDPHEQLAPLVVLSTVSGLQSFEDIRFSLAANVPEPSLMLQLALGLGLLVLYGMWQRRPAGLQIG